MTLNEAIERYISNAEYERTHGNLQGCLEFKQLADWLKELKQSNSDEEIESYENEIEDLHNRLDIAEYDKERLREEVTNLETKIKELQSNSDEDCISRKAVINRLNLLYRRGSDEVKKALESDSIGFDIAHLPSIQPKAKVGHWIKTPKAVMGEGYMWFCDKCEHQVYQDSSKLYPSEKFCPNCGAKMEGIEK